MPYKSVINHALVYLEFIYWSENGNIKKERPWLASRASINLSPVNLSSSYSMQFSSYISKTHFYLPVKGNLNKQQYECKLS